MQTYLYPPEGVDISSVSENLQYSIKQYMGSGDSAPSKIVEHLFQLFYGVFPYSHVLVTLASERKEDEFFHVYPKATNAKASLNSPREQLIALRSGARRVVRIGSSDDHGIIIGLVHQLFPGTPFNVLVMRTIVDDRFVFSFTFICPGAKSRFEDRHAALAFDLIDLLADFFIKKHPAKVHHAPVPAINPPDAERYLSIEELPGMKRVSELIWHVSRQHCPILILGESGTGKESVAQTLFRSSARVDAPFVKVNCGSLPDTLIDSELFGHEKGAFTGAVQSRKGIFERANRGTLLLDEIGELPMPAQTRLLRVLQEGVLERVGGNEEQRIDVRIIAATHRNLAKMVDEGKFRADLFFRLNVFPILIPPLRKRPQDIPVLIAFLLKKKCGRYGLSRLPEISPENMKELEGYSWPGNVRELDNALERAIILWAGDISRPFRVVLTSRFMPGNDATFSSSAAQASTAPEEPKASAPAMPLNDGHFPTLDEAMAAHITKALEISGGKLSGRGGAAELLGINASTLRSRMEKLGILDMAR